MPTNSDSELGVSPMKRHEEYYFRDGNICFLVRGGRGHGIVLMLSIM